MKTTNRLLVTDDGAELELAVPFKWAICGRCDGDGTHTNPAIDGHGITADEWNGPDWDDESRETYLSGGYDVSCEVCGGSGKVQEQDYDSLPDEVRELLEEDDRFAAEYEAERAHELRLGY